MASNTDIWDSLGTTDPKATRNPSIPEDQYQHLLDCRDSGQIPESAWQEHLKDKGFREWVEGQTEPSKEPELKPCPFCGGEATTWTTYAYSADILNGMKLKDLECLVALDDGGTGWIISRSDHIRERDILMECSADDNGFNGDWDKGLSVGVYKVTIKPWAHQDYFGEWDNGIDVMKVEKLWVAAP